MKLEDKIIVKIQISLNDQTALVYNEDLSIFHQFSKVSPEIMEQVGPSKKAYYYAVLDGKDYVLADPAPEQDW